MAQQYEPLNLTVHHRSKKTGQVTHETPYRLHIEHRVRMFEMPKGSGNFFYENGAPVEPEKCPKLTPVVTQLSREQQIEKLIAERNSLLAEKEAREMVAAAESKAKEEEAKILAAKESAKAQQESEAAKKKEADQIRADLAKLGQGKANAKVG